MITGIIGFVLFVGYTAFAIYMVERHDVFIWAMLWVGAFVLMAIIALAAFCVGLGMELGLP